MDDPAFLGSSAATTPSDFIRPGSGCFQRSTFLRHGQMLKNRHARRILPNLGAWKAFFTHPQFSKVKHTTAAAQVALIALAC